MNIKCLHSVACHKPPLGNIWLSVSFSFFPVILLRPQQELTSTHWSLCVNPLLLLLLLLETPMPQCLVSFLTQMFFLCSVE